MRYALTVAALLVALVAWSVARTLADAAERLTEERAARIAVVESME